MRINKIVKGLWVCRFSEQQESTMAWLFNVEIDKKISEMS